MLDRHREMIIMGGMMRIVHVLFCQNIPAHRIRAGSHQTGMTKSMGWCIFKRLA